MVTNNLQKTPGRPRVVIIGGGFGGINAAKKLKNADVDVLMLDKHNYHTFQPLLYQVAMGELEADSIAFPIRRIFYRQKNFDFHLTEVQKIDGASQVVNTSIGDVNYDYLIVATGANTNFFGNTQIERNTMPMKNIAEALNIRSLVIQNIEKAVVTADEAERKALLTFVVVGGGPTGVELAGSLAEFKSNILRWEFPKINPDEMQVYVVEGKPELIAALSDKASVKAKVYLDELGVTVYNSVHVKSYDGNLLCIDDGKEIITRNVFWAAGVKGESPEGIKPESMAKGNRILVDEFSRVKGYGNVFAIGDVAAMITADMPAGVPGVAQGAIQTGENAARNIMHLMKGENLEVFKYDDKGSLATIGRNKAVADIGKAHFAGVFAWLLWAFVHIFTLAGFSNKLVVFVSWVINYFTKNSDNRVVVRNFDTKTMMTDPVAR
ncbi:NAD(P)/FAD-dependent oxidoreductase [Mucilaginibacter sp.]